MPVKVYHFRLVETGYVILFWVAATRLHCLPRNKWFCPMTFKTAWVFKATSTRHWCVSSTAARYAEFIQHHDERRYDKNLRDLGAHLMIMFGRHCRWTSLQIVAKAKLLYIEICILAPELVVALIREVPLKRRTISWWPCYRESKQVLVDMQSGTESTE